MCEASDLSIALFASMNALAGAEAQLHENDTDKKNECIVTSALVHAMRVAHAACEAALARVEPMYDDPICDAAEYALCKTEVASALDNAQTIVSALEYASTLLPLPLLPESLCDEVGMRAAIDAKSIGAVALGVVLFSEFECIVPPHDLFLYALRRGFDDISIQVLRMLMLSPKLQETITNCEYGFTALMLASQQGHVEAIALLLACPAVAASAGFASLLGNTALMVASFSGHVEAIKVLFACPAVVASASLQNCDGDTALMLASVKGHVEAIVMLLACPAVVESASVTDNNGNNTALMLATKLGLTEVVITLLACPAIVASAYIPDNNGDTVMMLASRRGYVSIITALLACPGGAAFACTANEYGYTPLMIASYFARKSAIIALMTCPAGVASASFQNNDGNTALMIASKAGHAEIVNALLECPAVIASANTRNNDGKTALMLAQPYAEIVECIEFWRSARACPAMKTMKTVK